MINVSKIEQSFQVSIEIKFHEEMTLSFKFALIILTHNIFFQSRLKRARASQGKLIVFIALE